MDGKMKRYLILFIIVFVSGLFLFLLLDNDLIPGSRESEEQQKNEIETEELQKKIDETSGIIIDVRSREEYEAGHLQKADYNFDLLNGDLENQLEKLDKNKTYYLYCRSGNRSGKALTLMKQKGFEHVYNMGGLNDLIKAGFITE